jgi:hypothetical protein
MCHITGLPFNDIPCFIMFYPEFKFSDILTTQWHNILASYHIATYFASALILSPFLLVNEIYSFHHITVHGVGSFQSASWQIATLNLPEHSSEIAPFLGTLSNNLFTRAQFRDRTVPGHAVKQFT